MKRLMIILICLFCFGESQAQLNATFDLVDHFDDWLLQIPGRDEGGYLPPDATQRTNLELCLNQLRSGDAASAHETAATFDYEVVVVSGESDYWLLREKSSSANYWGRLVINPTSSSRLVIQAPHPKYDSNTGKEAAYAFRNTDTYALMIAGAHRCNASQQSECDGTTSVCGSSAAYRTSDQAHDTNSWFQITTEVLSQADSLVFLQLHGFAKGNDDPDLIMSSGSRDVPEEDWLSQMKDAYLDEDFGLTFEIAHVNTAWTRLVAFTNTQGRFLNESAAPCTEVGTLNSGRFLHLEQARPGLRENETDWDKLVGVVAKVFGETEVVAGLDLPVLETKIYPNPVSGFLHLEWAQRGNYQLTINDLGGKTIIYQALSEVASSRINLTELQPGIYMLNVRSAKGVFFQKLIKY